VYEMMWKNTVDLDRLQMTILCMCIACCIPKARNTRSEYVILLHHNSGYMNVPRCYNCLSCCANENVTSRGEVGAGEYGKLLISYAFLHAHFFSCN